MPSYYTQFSCLLPVGSASNVQAALAIYQAFVAEKEAGEEEAGFVAVADRPATDPDRHNIWLYSGENGDVENVIAYAFQCGKALGLTGPWGFRWSLSCSRPLLDGYGGGAQLLDLGTGQTIDWIDLDDWLCEQADAYELAKASPATLPAAAVPPALPPDVQEAAGPA